MFFLVWKHCVLMWKHYVLMIKQQQLEALCAHEKNQWQKPDSKLSISLLFFVMKIGNVCTSMLWEETSNIHCQTFFSTWTINLELHSASLVGQPGGIESKDDIWKWNETQRTIIFILGLCMVSMWQGIGLDLGMNFVFILDWFLEIVDLEFQFRISPDKIFLDFSGKYEMKLWLSVQILNWKVIFDFQFRIWTETMTFSSESELKMKYGFSVQNLNWKVYIYFDHYLSCCLWSPKKNTQNKEYMNPYWFWNQISKLDNALHYILMIVSFQMVDDQKNLLSFMISITNALKIYF